MTDQDRLTAIRARAEQGNNLPDACDGVGQNQPACHPGRLCSLLEIYMRVVRLDELLSKSRSLWNQADLVSGLNDSIKRDVGLEQIENGLRALDSICESMGLQVSRLHIKSTVDLLSKTLPSTGIRVFASDPGYGVGVERAVAIVTDNIEKELSLVTFYRIPTEKRKFLEAFGPDSDPTADGAIEPLWEPILARFPSVSFDVKEACKSYAVERNTGCVFHLMRALELMLHPLAATFNVDMDHKNWGKALDEIEKGIKFMPNDPAWSALPDWKEQKEYFSQVASQFYLFKEAWRNYTAHARGKYDPQEASDIMTGVRAFGTKLSLRFSE